MMREILKQNETAVREAGRQLVEIGAELAGGKIDEALARLASTQGQYAGWEELDQARADIEGVKLLALLALRYRLLRAAMARMAAMASSRCFGVIPSASGNWASVNWFE